MQLVISNMTSVFNADKTAGSYFIIFILSLVIIYNVNRDRNKYYVLFAVGIMLLLIMNPLTVWIISRVFPVLSSYTSFILWIPTLLYVPFACVELLENIKNSRRKNLLVILLFLIIALSGNVFGLYNDGTQVYPTCTGEQKDIITQLEDKKDAVILADETIAPLMRIYSDDLILLYGKDLWTPNMDLGIMDGYSEEMLSLYEAMKNPKNCINDITSMAAMYECDIIVLRKYNGYPKKTGAYQLVWDTNHYLIYELQ